ncbi:hypothetical protein SDRG_12557 [Saprolegnia diclina VS20]|uniref:Phospholipid scramblase n=1 Tax=Saprolegnia diclina (strain VS20) TaxID=1156394 RepID=T0Q595_SAPDV|nr:hypothetical protein SDRG_12557 [Saprolegnia diclina VS20]EQC29786.1 hypothetical protein SDRG_12557 [Saprolegnia diclina VS20]|eukprot:XP_008616852.1 hypothetical protein SDRG_12557 [Saprolegnia diclina VS20]
MSCQVPMMAIDTSLANTRGLLIHQKFQAVDVVADVLDLPYEAKNKYRIHHMPPDKRARSHPHDAEGWQPTTVGIEALDKFLFAHEESGLCMRMILKYLGCSNLRPMKMHIMVEGATGDAYVIDRPFRLGGAYCLPLTMNLSAVHGSELIRIGRARENFSSYIGKCFQACCLCTTYTDIERLLPDNTFSKRYTIRLNVACCGRTNNFCGGTCFKRNAVYDILDVQDNVVAHLQLTAADTRSWCRAMGSFNTYILEFPPDSTPEDRALLVTALFQIEFAILNS